MSMERRGLTITTQLLGLAIAPALLMFIVVSAGLYGARMNEVQRDANERGRLLAAALAEASRYGVVSGNAPSLQASLQGLVATDRSIAALEVMDASHRTVAAVTSPSAGAGEMLPFERAIHVQPVGVDLFDATGSPHIADPAVINSAIVRIHYQKMHAL